MPEAANRVTNVWLDREASRASKVSFTSDEFEHADMRPVRTAPALPVSMLLLSNSAHHTAATHSFRMAYRRMNFVSMTMSVLASHSNTITLQEVVQSIQMMDELARQIDKRQSMLNMTLHALMDALRTCPLVRFREDLIHLDQSQVSLVDMNSLNQYELDRWARVCAKGQ